MHTSFCFVLSDKRTNIFRYICFILLLKVVWYRSSSPIGNFYCFIVNDMSDLLITSLLHISFQTLLICDVYSEVRLFVATVRIPLCDTDLSSWEFRSSQRRAPDCIFGV
jgi:hypothetical protein